MTTTTDHAAIARLENLFQRQRQACLAAPNPSLDERRALMLRIPGLLMSNARRIAEALRSDYGHHSDLTAYAFDVVNVAGRAQYAASMLPTWMARDCRAMEPHQLYGSSKAYIEHQPKGVIGNMPAWNFPVDLSLGPLCEMLAAGNRAYEERFDRVFIIRAAGRDAEEILRQLRRRLDNTDDAERTETIEQLTQIALLRAQEVVG